MLNVHGTCRALREVFDEALSAVRDNPHVRHQLFGGSHEVDPLTAFLIVPKSQLVFATTEEGHVNINEWKWSSTPAFLARLEREVQLQRHSRKLRKQPPTKRGIALHQAVAAGMRDRRAALRYANLAIGFLRGHTYKAVEANSSTRPSGELLVHFIPVDTFARAGTPADMRDRLEAWISGEVEPIQKRRLRRRYFSARRPRVKREATAA